MGAVGTFFKWIGLIVIIFYLIVYASFYFIDKSIEESNEKFEQKYDELEQQTKEIQNEKKALEEEKQEEEKTNNNLLDEFHKHTDLSSEDVNEFDKLSNKKEDHLETKVEDIEWYSESISLMQAEINLLEKYIGHENSFYDFIVENDEELKELEIDTFFWKTSTKDRIVTFNQIIDSLESTIESSYGIISIKMELQGLSNIEESTYECSYNTYNCDAFSTYAQAKAVFDECGGLSNDVHHLDGDQDGIPCEGLYYQ